MANELVLKSADLYATTSLDKLAELINRGHEEIHLHVRRTALEVAQVGAWLTAAKGKCVHGEWLPWLEEKCDVLSLKTVQRYMRVYEKVQGDSSEMTNMLPTAAYKMLGIVKDSSDNVHFSSASAEWSTPLSIIEAVQEVLGTIDLDPCSDEAKTVPATKRFKEKDDGLAKEWAGKVYMNPPYGDVIDAWVTKLIASHESGEVPEAIALVPSRTDTAWFRKFDRYSVCFIDGRLKFGGQENSAPFPSAVFYLGNNHAKFRSAFRNGSIRPPALERIE